MNAPPIADLLDRLAGDDAGRAWNEFLERFSPLLMHVVRRKESHASRANDCFLWVCDALSADGFARLRKFRPDGRAQFSTWLMAVVVNLCVDWQRHERGRARPFQAIARLPELDQRVYHCLFVRGMRRTDCLRALEPNYPGLTEAQLAEINARLFGLLTPQQRWQVAVRATNSRPSPDGESLEDDGPARQSADPGPAELAESEEERARLAEALAQLPAPQRLLLQLRFEQNLTLVEVARLTRQPDPFRAKRQIQAALIALGALLRPADSGRTRKMR